jgi:transposase
MKQYHHFFGVDISKKTVDITFISEQENVHKQFANNAEGMVLLFQWTEELNLDFSRTLFCLEATGLYCFTLTHFLAEKSIDVWVEHAAQIKKATALARGKNDKVDSLRIAQYAMKNLDRLRLWKPISATLEQIKNLATLRERIVDTQKRLMAPIKEFTDLGNLEMAKLLTKSIKKTIVALEKDLANIEKQILSTLEKDIELNAKYHFAKSVVGIGFVTAINLIIHTNGFSEMNETRALACYCGVAPFEYSSGTSIKGRTKVHHMANKKLKCNLHMASLSAVKLDADLKQYYERKVAEGKNKMSVLNAVRNKLLARVLACVNKGKNYVNRAA